MRVLFFCAPESGTSFIEPVAEKLAQYYSIDKCYSTDAEKINQALNTVDEDTVIFCEWANELTAFLSKQHKFSLAKKTLCRFHSYEIFISTLNDINWRLFSKVIFVADYIKRIVAPTLKIEDTSQTIPNGVDLEATQFTTKQPGFNLAFIGNVSYKKGFMLLLHAFAALHKLNPKYTLSIAGDIEERRLQIYSEYFAEETGIEDNIIYDGHINNIQSWVQDKNYIVCSSPWESQNLGVMEAMAAGIKPIIHNFLGAKEIYQEKWLWTTIDEFITQVQHTKYTSQQYRDFIEQRYNLNTTVEKIRALIDEK